MTHAHAGTMTKPSAEQDERHITALETVFQNLGDGVLVLAHDLSIIKANQWIEKRYSGTAPLAGQKCYAALYGRPSACPACPSLRAMQTGKRQVQMAKIAAGADRVLWFEMSAYPLTAPSGESVGVIEQIKDMTRLRQTEDRLRDQAALRYVFMDESRDGIVVLDPTGRVLEANQLFARMLGMTVDALRQTHVWDWDPQWDKDRLLSLLERAEVLKERFEMRFERDGAPPTYVEIASVGMTNAGERLIYWTCRDISEKKALEDQVRDLGIHDPLTHLYDRRYVLERLSETAAEYQRGGSEFCITILDLDEFGKINDIHGPKAADVALEAFARTIAMTVRPYDLVGRFAGDEFIIVSKNAGLIETEAMLRRIVGAIRNKDLSFEGHMMRLTFSCGLAHCGEFSGKTLSVDAMITRAYELLRAAKEAGGDMCVSGLSPQATPAPPA
jgi:diguanylate cyclase (GGDEF)-like protein/PAS domain S-box-containing protein